MKNVPIVRAGIINKNNRIYSQDRLKDICDQINKLSEKDKLFGTIGHRSDTIVDLRDISHIAKNPIIKGDILYSDIMTLQTPMGKILAAGLNKNRKYVVFRPRGTGSLSPAGQIMSDYKLISIDAIPTETDAFDGLL